MLKKISTTFLCMFVMSMRKLKHYYIYIVHPGCPTTWHFFVVILLSFMKVSCLFDLHDDF